MIDLLEIVESRVVEQTRSRVVRFRIQLQFIEKKLDDLRRRLEWRLQPDRFRESSMPERLLHEFHEVLDVLLILLEACATCDPSSVSWISMPGTPRGVFSMMSQTETMVAGVAPFMPRTGPTSGTRIQLDKPSGILTRANCLVALPGSDISTPMLNERFEMNGNG